MHAIDILPHMYTLGWKILREGSLTCWCKDTSAVRNLMGEKKKTEIGHAWKWLYNSNSGATQKEVKLGHTMRKNALEFISCVFCVYQEAAFTFVRTRVRSHATEFEASGVLGDIFSASSSEMRLCELELVEELIQSNKMVALCDMKKKTPGFSACAHTAKKSFLNLNGTEKLFAKYPCTCRETAFTCKQQGFRQCIAG